LKKSTQSFYLTKSQKDAWKRWAKDHKEWRKVDWEQVIWLDECYVYIGDDRGMVWVTRGVDEEFDNACVIPTFKQLSLCIMVWDCIMKADKGLLVVLEYPGG
jgi:hypothetical protein